MISSSQIHTNELKHATIVPAKFRAFKRYSLYEVACSGSGWVDIIQWRLPLASTILRHTDVFI